MKVSVIIPVYNVSKYIERCLLSVLNQTWQDLEVILVNDCTPDDSMEIAERVVVAHPRREVVRWLAHEENRGLSAARNTGIFEAMGEYLYFLDSDDYIPENAIANLADAAVGNVDFVIGNYAISGADRWAPPLLLPSGDYQGNSFILSDYVHGRWYVMAWNKLVNRSFLLRHNLFFQEGIVHEDDLWSFKLACTACSMSVVNVVTYFYSMQPDSIMRAPSIRNLECRVSVLGYIYDFIKAAPDLESNPEIYRFFETLKAKYFDRILYFTKDKGFRYSSYLQFRKKKYIPALKAIWKMRPGWKLVLRNVHYGLPVYAGFLYFTAFVKLSYYLLVLPEKMKRFLHIK
ncbi:glycosyltransferase family 2 protein [Bacteroides heparinolyticus]